MSIEDRHWYRVNGGEPLAALHRRLADVHDLKDEALIFAKVRGGEPVGIWNLTADVRCVGVQFPDGPPRGWRLKSGERYAIPDKRTRDGKEAAAAMQDLTLGWPTELWDAIDENSAIPTLGRRILFPKAGRIDGEWYIGIGRSDQPDEDGRHPRYDIPGLEPTSASTVLAAQERQRAQKKEGA